MSKELQNIAYEVYKKTKNQEWNGIFWPEEIYNCHGARPIKYRISPAVEIGNYKVRVAVIVGQSFELFYTHEV